MPAGEILAVGEQAQKPEVVRLPGDRQEPRADRVQITLQAAGPPPPLPFGARSRVSLQNPMVDSEGALSAATAVILLVLHAFS